MRTPKTEVRVAISKNGPYIVTGDIPLLHQSIGMDTEGGSEKWLTGDAFPALGTYALCRCGQSNSKPFCDGSHAKIGFDGTETAKRQPYLEQAIVFSGPVFSLTDVKSLCAFARFCDPCGQVWTQVANTDQAAVRESFLRQVGNCPSGRLVARDNTTGKLVEPELPISISLVEDPKQKCSGPLWLRGGIPVVAADGVEYEVRNRVTLCRCGQSKNKPFCDGAHVATEQ